MLRDCPISSVISEYVNKKMEVLPVWFLVRKKI